MERRFRCLIVFFLFLFSGYGLDSFADPASCPPKVDYYGKLEVQRLYLNRSKRCTLNVRIRELKPKGSSREYLFTDSGRFGIFSGVTFRGARNSNSTAGREFHIPPSGPIPTAHWDSEARILKVTSSSGKVFTFSEEEKRLTSISGVQFAESADVQLARSSFRIIKTDKRITDWGWALGTYPTEPGKNGKTPRPYVLNPGEDYSNFIGFIEPQHFRGRKSLFVIPTPTPMPKLVPLQPIFPSKSLR